MEKKCENNKNGKNEEPHKKKGTIDVLTVLYNIDIIPFTSCYYN